MVVAAVHDLLAIALIGLASSRPGVTGTRFLARRRVDCRIGTVRRYGGDSVRRAQIILGILVRARDLLAGWARAKCRRGGRVPRRSPHRCSASWRSVPVHHSARRHWLPSLGQAGGGARFLPPSVTACCRTRALPSSARLARRRPRAVCDDTTPCATGLLFEHLGLLWAILRWPVHAVCG